MKATTKLERLIVNQHGYSLRVKTDFDFKKLVNAKEFSSEEAFQKAFAETNLMDYIEGDENYIPELITHDDEIFISGTNTCFGEKEDVDSVEDAINNYCM